MSNMVFLMALRRMSVAITAHGFRSSFRDWAAEQTSFSRDACELALGHSVSNKTEAAYRRGDQLEIRRQLNASWERFIGTPRRSLKRNKVARQQRCHSGA
jgi:integrase